MDRDQQHEYDNSVVAVKKPWTPPRVIRSEAKDANAVPGIVDDGLGSSQAS
jgi:hypothetical protein